MHSKTLNIHALHRVLRNPSMLAGAAISSMRAQLKLTVKNLALSRVAILESLHASQNRFSLGLVPVHTQRLKPFWLRGSRLWLDMLRHHKRRARRNSEMNGPEWRFAPAAPRYGGVPAWAADHTILTFKACSFFQNTEMQRFPLHSGSIRPIFVLAKIGEQPCQR
jgi:hypothetical protein